MPLGRRDLCRLAPKATISGAVTFLVWTLVGRQGETSAPVTSALVQSPEDNIALSPSEVIRQLAQVLSPANQRTSCLSTIYPGGTCSCAGQGQEDTCTGTPRMDDKTAACLGPAHLVPGRPCLVYSATMRGGLSFETEMARFGCMVHVFDPLRRLNVSHLPAGVDVHTIGVGDVSKTVSIGGNQFEMRTLDDLVHHMGHKGRQIDYLKLADTGEWNVLRQQLDSGAVLRKIQQLAVTLHLRYPRGIFQPGVGEGEQPSLEDTHGFLQLVKAMERTGFQLVRSQPGEETFGDTGLTQEYRVLWARN